MLNEQLHRFSKKAPEPRKSSGAHYTPTMLAEFVADAIDGHFEPANRPVTIVDPAVGEGELLAALFHRWQGSVNVFGFDTDASATARASHRLRAEFPAVNCQLDCLDFLDVSLANGGGDLFCKAPK